MSFEDLRYEVMWHFLFALAGVVITYYLNHKMKQGAVRASAGSSLLVGLVFFFLEGDLSNKLQTSLSLVYIGASFIGMSNTQHFRRPHQFVIAASIFTCLYLASSALFSGYGGKLGLMANIALVGTIGVHSLNKTKA